VSAWHCTTTEKGWSCLICLTRMVTRLDVWPGSYQFEHPGSAEAQGDPRGHLGEGGEVVEVAQEADGPIAGERVEVWGLST
jgi:hypothetical protein